MRTFSKCRRTNGSHRTTTNDTTTRRTRQPTLVHPVFFLLFLLILSTTTTTTFSSTSSHLSPSLFAAATQDPHHEEAVSEESIASTTTTGSSSSSMRNDIPDPPDTKMTPPQHQQLEQEYQKTKMEYERLFEEKKQLQNQLRSLSDTITATQQAVQNQAQIMELKLQQQEAKQQFETELREWKARFQAVWKEQQSSSQEIQNQQHRIQRLQQTLWETRQELHQANALVRQLQKNHQDIWYNQIYAIARKLAHEWILPLSLFSRDFLEGQLRPTVGVVIWILQASWSELLDLSNDVLILLRKNDHIRSLLDSFHKFYYSSKPNSLFSSSRTTRTGKWNNHELKEFFESIHNFFASESNDNNSARSAGIVVWTKYFLTTMYSAILVALQISLDWICEACFSDVTPKWIEYLRGHVSEMAILLQILAITWIVGTILGVLGALVAVCWRRKKGKAKDKVE